MRRAAIHRITKETDIRAALVIEGRGRLQNFYREFVSSITCWSFSRIMAASIWSSNARGDLDVDQHHTWKMSASCSASSSTKRWASKRGILRAGYFVMPMDETLGLAAVDFCGRTSTTVDTKVRARLVGDLQAELVHDFFDGFARGARASVHARVLYGRSSHHKIESLFKAFARALRAACWRDRRMARLLPSTKGLL